jgi:hypothetical protein
MCSKYQDFTNGTSITLRVRPLRLSKGWGAQNNSIADAVFSVYKGFSSKNGSTSSGKTKSKSSSSSPKSSCSWVTFDQFQANEKKSD